MIRAFFRANPNNKTHSCRAAAATEIDEVEILAALKLLKTERVNFSQAFASSEILLRVLQVLRSENPNQENTDFPASLEKPPSAKKDVKFPSQTPSSHTAAIVPTAQELEALALDTQFLRQPATGVTRRHHRGIRHLDKVLFVSACLYLIGVIGWLLHQRLDLSLKSDRPILEEETSPSAQAHAVEAREAALSKATPFPSNSEPSATIPSVSESQRTPKTAKQNSIPVPPVRQLPPLEVAVPTPTLTPPPPKPISLPTATPPPAPAPQLTQSPPKPSPASEAPSPPPEATSPPKVSKLPSPGSSTVVPPAIDSRLVGILQLGDRSVALFALNDVTQQVKVGEQIGSSGWTLKTLTEQTAQIYRDQEQRSLYVGEGF